MMSKKSVGRTGLPKTTKEILRHLNLSQNVCFFLLWMFLRGGCLLVGKKEKKNHFFFFLAAAAKQQHLFYKKQTVKSFISSKFSMELADAAWSLQCAETTNKIFAESRTCECGRRYGQTESNDSEANFTQSALSLTGADAAIPRWRFSRRARAILLRWSRTLTPTLRALQQFMLTSTYQNLCAHAKPQHYYYYYSCCCRRRSHQQQQHRCL